MSDRIPVGAAVLDVPARTLAGPGGTARLTPTPLRLLVCMAAVAPRVVPYPEAIAAMGDRYGRAGPETVQNHLRAVRRAPRAARQRLRGGGGGRVRHRGASARARGG